MSPTDVHVEPKIKQNTNISDLVAAARNVGSEKTKQNKQTVENIFKTSFIVRL